MKPLNLGCNWVTWRNRGDGVLRLEVPAGECPDMDGAVTTGCLLDSTCRRIEVYAGHIEDGGYRLGHDGKWVSYRPVPWEMCR